MTLAQFDVVVEPPIAKNWKIRQVLSFLLLDIVVPLLVVLLFNAIGVALYTGALVLVHYLQFAEPFGQSESAKHPRGFVVAIVCLIFVHVAAITFNTYRAMRVWIEQAKKCRRMVYIMGWCLMAGLWVGSLTAMARDNFDDDVFGFKDKVQ